MQDTLTKKELDLDTIVKVFNIRKRFIETTKLTEEDKEFLKETFEDLDITYFLGLAFTRMIGQEVNIDGSLYYAFLKKYGKDHLIKEVLTDECIFNPATCFLVDKFADRINTDVDIVLSAHCNLMMAKKQLSLFTIEEEFDNLSSLLKYDKDVINEITENKSTDEKVDLINNIYDLNEMLVHNIKKLEDKLSGSLTEALIYFLPLKLKE